ncbi:MAG: succinate dehydrogenase/fumarate reductase transmembrane subunit [Phycisphaerales bacterium]
MSNPDGPLNQHHFLLRRLHSLTGIVPIGVFLIMHLTTNSTIAWGGLNGRAHGDGWFDRAVATFQHEVTFINEAPLLLLVEVTLWVSIAFHSILGVYYATTGKSNNGSYKYGGNTRYLLQRLTGYFGIFFIFYHIATLRWGLAFLVPGGTKWSHEYASSTLAAALRGGTEEFTAMGFAVSAFYFIGVTALVFHFANGLWTAAITWGFTISRAAQKRWGYVCAGLGAGLMLMAWASVVGFATLDYDQARAVEEAMLSGETHPADHHDEAHAETAAVEQGNTDG